jgi:hypothetical protein
VGSLDTSLIKERKSINPRRPTRATFSGDVPAASGPGLPYQCKRSPWSSVALRSLSPVSGPAPLEGAEGAVRTSRLLLLLGYCYYSVFPSGIIPN